MALTRRALKTMGIDEEKIDEIISLHTETVDGLKAELGKIRAAAESVPDLEKRLQRTQEELSVAKNDGWKDKYEGVKKEFDAYKADQEGKAIRATREKAYRQMLKEIGISEKRMDTVVKAAALDGVLDRMEVDDEGWLKDADKLKESVRTEWSDFIVNTQTGGVHTPTPPTNGGDTMTREGIVKIKDPTERRAAIAQNMNLFEKG